MGYQTKLKVGDVIAIKGQVGPFIVVRSEHQTEDPGDGAPYWVDEIDVIKTSLLEIDVPKGERGVAISFTDPAVKSFYFEGGCMTGKGKRIKDSDVTVIGTSKVSTEMSITYTVKSIKSY